MRHVKSDQLPKLIDLSALNAAKAELALITDAEKRAEFIKKNAPKWTAALRHALWGLNGCKRVGIRKPSAPSRPGAR